MRPPVDRQQFGRAGEDCAAEHLAALGYRILERNFRIGHAEADLVALTPQGAVAIVEVKTRTGAWRGEARVDGSKQHHLLRMAAALSTRPQFAKRMFQFDVVAVSLNSDGTPVHAVHFPHAFDASGTQW